MRDISDNIPLLTSVASSNNIIITQPSEDQNIDNDSTQDRVGKCQKDNQALDIKGRYTIIISCYFRHDFHHLLLMSVNFYFYPFKIMGLNMAHQLVTTQARETLMHKSLMKLRIVMRCNVIKMRHTQT